MSEIVSLYMFLSHPSLQVTESNDGIQNGELMKISFCLWVANKFRPQSLEDSSLLAHLWPRCHHHQWPQYGSWGVRENLGGAKGFQALANLKGPLWEHTLQVSEHCKYVTCLLNLRSLRSLRSTPTTRRLSQAKRVKPPLKPLRTSKSTSSSLP